MNNTAATLILLDPGKLGGGNVASELKMVPPHFSNSRQNAVPATRALMPAGRAASPQVRPRIK